MLPVSGPASSPPKNIHLKTRTVIVPVNVWCPPCRWGSWHFEWVLLLVGITSTVRSWISWNSTVECTVELQQMELLTAFACDSHPGSFGGKMVRFLQSCPKRGQEGTAAEDDEHVTCSYSSPKVVHSSPCMAKQNWQNRTNASADAFKGYSWLIGSDIWRFEIWVVGSTRHSPCIAPVLHLKYR